jgi:hypothetical protein
MDARRFASAALPREPSAAPTGLNRRFGSEPIQVEMQVSPLLMRPNIAQLAA